MDTKKIERLTPEQEALLPVVRDEWLAAGLATGPADRPAAERGVAEAYRAAGLEPPRLVVWLDSPLAGAIGAELLSQRARVGRWVGWSLQRPDEVEDQVEAQVGEQVWNRLNGQVYRQVRAQIAEPIGNQIFGQVEDWILAQVRAQVRDQGSWQGWGPVANPIVAQVWEQVRAQAGKHLHRDQGAEYTDWDWLMHGQHEAGGMSFFDAARRIGLAACDQLAGLMRVARSAGWWWPFEHAVILTERPTELHRDDRGRLHNPHGPAVRYPDGFAVHAWHGVRVDEHVITGELTGADWLAEGNAEIRRVIAERLGYQRLLDGVRAERRHTDEYGTLWRIPDPTGRDEDIWLVDVVNATAEPDGTFKRYVLRVPPDLPTAHAAVAWTFNLPPEDYQPTAQT